MTATVDYELKYTWDDTWEIWGTPKCGLPETRWGWLLEAKSPNPGLHLKPLGIEGVKEILFLIDQERQKLRIKEGLTMEIAEMIANEVEGLFNIDEDGTPPEDCAQLAQEIIRVVAQSILLGGKL